MSHPIYKLIHKFKLMPQPGHTWAMCHMLSGKSLTMIKGHRSYNVTFMAKHVMYLLLLILFHTLTNSTHPFTCRQHSEITG